MSTVHDFSCSFHHTTLATLHYLRVYFVIAFVIVFNKIKCVQHLKAELLKKNHNIYTCFIQNIHVSLSLYYLQQASRNISPVLYQPSYYIAHSHHHHICTTMCSRNNTKPCLLCAVSTVPHTVVFMIIVT